MPENTTTVKVENRPDFIIFREDPYGHWKIKRERGQIPVQLQGMYTAKRYAEQAVQVYLRTLK